MLSRDAANAIQSFHELFVHEAAHPLRLSSTGVRESHVLSPNIIARLAFVSTSSRSKVSNKTYVLRATDQLAGNRVISTVSRTPHVLENNILDDHL